MYRRRDSINKSPEDKEKNQGKIEYMQTCLNEIDTDSKHIRYDIIVTVMLEYN